MRSRRKKSKFSLFFRGFEFEPNVFLIVLLLVFMLVVLIGCQKKVEKEVKIPSFNFESQTQHLVAQPGVVRLLLLGSDSRSESIEGRSDSIILVQLDTEKKRISLVSFPRDSRVLVPGYGYNKINSAMALGGPELTEKTVESLTGLPIDFYAVTTFIGFKKIISKLGGVNITLDKPINDRWAKAYLPAGPQQLSPSEALAFARARHLEGGDLTRAFHQQQILKALFSQHSKILSWAKLLFYLPIIFKNCQTNLNSWDTFLLLQAASEVPSQSFEHLVLKGSTGSRDGVSYVFLNEKFQKDVFDRLKQRKSLADLVKQ